MENINPEILQLGALATISVLLIKEIFAFLRAKKTNGGEFNQKLCDERHSFINKAINTFNDNIAKMENNFYLIKQNELKHMEDEIRRISEVQVKILTILEERENK